MPRYDYRCTSDRCGEQFEVIRGFHDDPAAACPFCGNSARRLISQVAVHFKGSGFYVTDNRASNGAGKASGSSERDSSSESASAKSDKKNGTKSPESKTASKAGSSSTSSSSTSSSE